MKLETMFEQCKESDQFLNVQLKTIEEHLIVTQQRYFVIKFFQWFSNVKRNLVIVCSIFEVYKRHQTRNQKGFGQQFMVNGKNLWIT